MKRLFIFLMMLMALLQNSFAEETSPWLMRVRAVHIKPDVDSDVTGMATNVRVQAATVPEVDFSYFFTKNIAAELILATSNHDVKTSSGLGLGDVWVLPPTVNMQYHFNQDGKFRPYIGAGLGYIFYYGEDSGSVDSVKYDDGISYSMQAGFDYMLNDKWGVNLDVKKLYHKTTASVNGGAVRADVDLDPWVIGTGISYRF